eukprot:CAMPEP_0196577352 /NCGR_PEP_ID=MMETSP1081-20130531/6428_1 /TAXON_ID=36882 /ORGANISM="Pyramimonas amylifera, Strain CCMP720" /LENGTH=337 /DNA_ID=CAMNT_0041896247 /DNA_START=1 /DNA_END=1014 /DNA_ORIENTATION=-
MYAGVILMSYITGKLTAILSHVGAKEALAHVKVNSVKTYCKYRSLPESLRNSVLEYFEVRYARKNICDEGEILNEMSPALKAQVVCFIFRNIIEAVPFFRGCSDLFLSEVLCCMDPLLYAPADIIIQKGQRDLAMFILAKGCVVAIDSSGHVIRELEQGEYFGEIGLFFGVRRTATICSVTFCETFRLAQDKFVKVQRMYPEMRGRIHQQAESMFGHSISCYLCGKYGHISIQCKKPKYGDDSEYEKDEGIGEDFANEEVNDQRTSSIGELARTVARNWAGKRRKKSSTVEQIKGKSNASPCSIDSPKSLVHESEASKPESSEDAWKDVGKEPKSGK